MTMVLVHTGDSKSGLNMPVWTRLLVHPTKYDCLNLDFILETVVEFLLVSLSTGFAYFENFLNL